MSVEKLWTVRYVRVNLSCFFQYISHYLLLASLPIFTIQVLNQSESKVGLVLAFFQIGAFLFRPLAGMLVDRYDKKRVLTMALIFFCVVCFFHLGVHSLTYLLIVRFLLGAGFATGTTATANMVALLSPLSRKGEGVGYFAVFTSIAMVLGPFIGLTLISVFTFDVLFEVVAACGLMALLCGSINYRQGEIAEKPVARALDWRGFIEPSTLPIACCGALLSVIYGSLLGFLPVYARENGMLSIASAFFAVYALAIIVTRPLIGKWFDRFGARKIVNASVVFYIAGFALLSQMHDAATFLVSAVLIGIGFGGLNPSFQALAIMAAPSQRSGLATSTYLLSMDAGVGMGSLAMGFLASCTDFRMMYMACAFLAIALFGLFQWTYKPGFQYKNDGGVCQCESAD